VQITGADRCREGADNSNADSLVISSTYPMGADSADKTQMILEREKKIKSYI
jgi:hypothetical protein